MYTHILETSAKRITGLPAPQTVRFDLSICGPADFAGLGGKRPTPPPPPPAPKTRTSDIETFELQKWKRLGSKPCESHQWVLRWTARAPARISDFGAKLHYLQYAHAWVAIPDPRAEGAGRTHILPPCRYSRFQHKKKTKTYYPPVVGRKKKKNILSPCR